MNFIVLSLFLFLFSVMNFLFYCHIKQCFCGKLESKPRSIRDRYESLEKNFIFAISNFFIQKQGFKKKNKSQKSISQKQDQKQIKKKIID